MTYITYEQYTELGGDLIPQSDFDKVARVVSKKVDGLTFNRIVKCGFENLTTFQKETIQEAMMDLCDFEYDNSDILNSAISNYSLNGVSVGFGGSQGGIRVSGMTVSRNGYQLLQQTGLTCRLI